MAKLCGKWKLENTENFDAYMKAVGVGMALRKLGNLAKPSQNISCDGDTWTIKTSSTAKNTEVSFKIGQEFDEKTADGRHVKTTFTVEGDNKLIADQKGEPNSVHTREVQADDSMVMTLEASGVVCKRTYKRGS